jgi:hypothetical protein
VLPSTSTRCTRTVPPVTGADCSGGGVGVGESSGGVGGGAGGVTGRGLISGRFGCSGSVVWSRRGSCSAGGSGRDVGGGVWASDRHSVICANNRLQQTKLIPVAKRGRFMKFRIQSNCEAHSLSFAVYFAIVLFPWQNK